jgi:hypothetical protein
MLKTPVGRIKKKRQEVQNKMGWIKLLETRKPDGNVVWRSSGKLEELL